VHVVDFPEIGDKPFPVDLDGSIRLPVVGAVQVAGMRVSQIEAAIAEKLKTYLLHPDVTVSVTEFRSQPVSVLGAVGQPGVQQVQGRKTLVEVISQAGGLGPEAGPVLKISRSLRWGPIPLPNAVNDPSGEYSVAEIDIKSLLEARNPSENLLVRPNDVISVPKATMVYVIGEVVKPGNFAMSSHERTTALQVVSMAGGFAKLAKSKEAHILRLEPGSTERKDIPINLSKIMEAKAPDVALQAEDILYVPNSLPKSVGLRTLDAVIQMGTGYVVWGRY
jgi:polysaccharide export outer membrane protein